MMKRQHEEASLEADPSFSSSTTSAVEGMGTVSPPWQDFSKLIESGELRRRVMVYIYTGDDGNWLIKCGTVTQR
jgi:hypothetical protein